MNTYYVYIVASASGTLYVGVTNDLMRRVCEHKNDLVDCFTKKYQCHKLVYWENTESVESAILREKQIKNWRSEKKEQLINIENPRWVDLYGEISANT